MERKSEFEKDWYITWEAIKALGVTTYYFRKIIKKYKTSLQTKNKGRTVYYSRESLEFLKNVLEDEDENSIQRRIDTRYKYCKICGTELNKISSTANTVGYCSNCDKFFKKDRELVYMKDGTPVVI